MERTPSSCSGTLPAWPWLQTAGSLRTRPGQIAQLRRTGTIGRVPEELKHVGGERLRYCARCGAPLAVRLIETEDRPRLMCDRGHIHYVNPVLVVGVEPDDE